MKIYHEPEKAQQPIIDALEKACHIGGRLGRHRSRPRKRLLVTRSYSRFTVDTEDQTVLLAEEEISLVLPCWRWIVVDALTVSKAGEALAPVVTSCQQKNQLR